METLSVQGFNLVKDVLGSNINISKLNISESVANQNSSALKRNIQSARVLGQKDIVNKPTKIIRHINKLSQDSMEPQTTNQNSTNLPNTKNNFLKWAKLDASHVENVFFKKKKYFSDVQVVQPETDKNKISNSITHIEPNVNHSKLSVKNTEASKISQELPTNRSNEFDKKAFS